MLLRFLESLFNMKNKIKNFTVLIILLLVSFTNYSQTKKWTIEECVNYALQHNISIKQSELDLKLATIDKKVAVGSFLPPILERFGMS